MTFPGVERFLGVQEPRISFAPPSVVSTAAADDAVELCSAVGLVLDPWQVNTLRLMLGENAAGDWAAFEFGYQAQRQNGKGGVLEGRELAGLFLFGERDIIHSAHAADTARKAFLRMRNLVDGSAFLSKRVKKIIAAPGREHVELMDGRMLEYRTRTSGGGRGFSGTPVILDEAQELTAAELAAIMPVVSAQPNPQMIYTGTVKPGAAVFRGVVERGRQGIGDALGWAEWSAPDDADSEDVEAHRMANPAMGIRIAPSYIRNELEAFRGALAEDEWRMERLGIWPMAGNVGSVIPVDAWAAGLSGWQPPFSVQGGVMGVAVSMDRDYAVVAYAVESPRGVYVEAIAQTGDVDREGVTRSGIDWVLPFLVDVAGRREPVSVVVDKAGPASSLLNAMVASRLPVQVSDFAGWKAACAQFVDGVVEGRVEHSGQVQLTESVQGVQRRVTGDSWVYDRKVPGVRVAPVEAATLAMWGLVGTESARSKYEDNDLLVLG